MSKATNELFVNQYWQDRVAEAQKQIADKTIEETQKQIRKYYARAAEHCLDSFEAVVDKIYVGLADGIEPTPADLYKLDKYWQSQAQLRKELQRLGDKEISLMTKAFEDVFEEVYNIMALPTSSTFGTVSHETITQLINQVWCADGQMWSNRVWSNVNALADELNEQLVHIVATGKPTTELKKNLMERFNVSYNQANTLIQTEVAHVQTQAAKQRYIDSGVTEVEVWADYDERRCKLCGNLHQKKYLVNDTMPVPAHPNCRCCILPVIK